jgi:4-hydroxy-tetrahydrodipicolinate reductase
LNIALIGYGKMDKAIEAVALERGHQIIAKIDHDNQHDFTPENLGAADVAIEFTGPESALENVLRCVNAGTPTVCGSTGWLQQLAQVQQLVKEKNGSFLYASNFSVGVNIFFEINKKLAALMAGQSAYNVQVTEIHHTAKKDAPSGTAITIAEQILESFPAKKQWVNGPPVDTEDLVIESQRIDPAPGTHIVQWSSAIDDIEIKHTAHNRQGFALGAVLAAEFLQHKQGIFGMKDVLGL